MVFDKVGVHLLPDVPCKPSLPFLDQSGVERVGEEIKLEVSLSI
jgi:hypothetical protein